MKKITKLTVTLLLIALLAMSFTACSNNESANSKATDNSSNSEQSNKETADNNDKETEENYDGKLVFDHSLELKYAKNFSVDFYKGGYNLIKISDGRQFLTIPEGMSVPTELEDGVVTLQMPLDNILVSSTPTVSLINAIDKLDKISMVTTKYESWYIDEVKSFIDDGKISYIGSYKAPDYEMITAKQPQFSVFSTMLLSVPEVEEKLNELNVPIMLDQATYETHPLARVEWVKLYGVLFDCLDKATEAFDAQVAYVDGLDLQKTNNKSVAICYITSKGTLYARKGGDYMSKMVELAGGKYIFEDMKPEETGTLKMDFEQFYATAKDADKLIYVWSLGGKPENTQDLIEKNELFADFKAVKDGDVWCTTPDYFQISDVLGYMIKDINEMLSMEDNSVDELTYLKRLK